LFDRPGRIRQGGKKSKRAALLLGSGSKIFVGNTFTKRKWGGEKKGRLGATKCVSARDAKLPRKQKVWAQKDKERKKKEQRKKNTQFCISKMRKKHRIRIYVRPKGSETGI